MEISQEVVAVAAERRHLEPPVCAHRPPFGRSYTASGFTARTGPRGASLLPLAGPWWRRTSRSSEKRVLHHARPVSHGTGFEAIRLHALFTIRWRAVGGSEPLSGDDLSAH